MAPTAIGPPPTLAIPSDTIYEDGRVVRWPQIICSLWRHFREISRLVEMALRVCGARFVADKRPKGEYVLGRGNLLAGLTRIPGSWINSVPLRHSESSNRGGARSQEKKCLASRGDVKSKGWTLWRDSPPGVQR